MKGTFSLFILELLIQDVSYLSLASLMLFLELIHLLFQAEGKHRPFLVCTFALFPPISEQCVGKSCQLSSLSVLNSAKVTMQDWPDDVT